MNSKPKTIFKDRAEAGKILAKYFDGFKSQGVVVYALPRGGVVVGAEISRAIHAPLDLIITRKIGHPSQSEYAIGAVAENGHSIFNEEAVSDIDRGYLDKEIKAQIKEAQRRRETYLGSRKPISCEGKTAILTDDGIATGLTIKAAIKELKLHYKPKKIIVAVPVVSKITADQLQKEGVTVLAIDVASDFLGAIGSYYREFNPVEDMEVIKIMKINYNI